MSLLCTTAPDGGPALPRVPPLRAAPRAHPPPHPARRRRRHRPARNRRAPRADLLAPLLKPTRKGGTDDEDETPPLAPDARAPRAPDARPPARANARAPRGRGRRGHGRLRRVEVGSRRDDG